jgi:hypothetical protein
MNREKVDNIIYFIVLWIAFAAITLNVIALGFVIANLLK